MLSMVASIVLGFSFLIWRSYRVAARRREAEDEAPPASS
jgi:hypothetical protein